MENTDTKSGTKSETKSDIEAANKEISGAQDIFNSYLSLVPTEVSRLTVLAEQMIDGDSALYSRSNMKGHLTASALVFDEQSNALLIHHNALDRWLQPGGHLDSGEDPQAGACRELVEETGLSPDNFALHPVHANPALQIMSAASNMRAKVLPIDIDSHVIPPNAGKGEGNHLHHDFQYVYQLKDVDQKGAALKLQTNEVSQFKWVPIADLKAGKYGTRLARVAQKMLDLA